MKRNQSGFTIVELLIVIVVIGILAAITIVSFNGVTARAKDTEKRTDIAAIQKQLESYFAERNYYPLTESLIGGNGIPFAQANFLSKNPQQYMVNPNASDKTVGSLKDFTSPASDQYGYLSYKSDGSRCTSVTGDVATQCVKYILAYRTDSPNIVITVNSSNN